MLRHLWQGTNLSLSRFTAPEAPMGELVQLLKLRRDLRQGVEALMQGIETQPERSNLHSCIELVGRCMRLERDISLITGDLLQLEQPHGTG